MASPRRRPKENLFDSPSQNGHHDMKKGGVGGRARSMTVPICIAASVCVGFVVFRESLELFLCDGDKDRTSDPSRIGSSKGDLSTAMGYTFKAGVRKDLPSAAELLPLETTPEEWLWSPVTDQCSSPQGATSVVTEDPFPPSFDAALYEAANRPRVKADVALDLAHYNRHGRAEGWMASKGQTMREIINTDIVTKLPGDKLEIGPFLNPLIYDVPGIKYFDVLDMEGLKARAIKVNYPYNRPVPIDYVHPSGDLKSIPDKNSFSLIQSSHVIEHQLDLVRHLNAVSDLLMPGGYYDLMIPDKRYCFDHYVPPSTISEVLDDYYNDRYHDSSHKLRSVIEHRAMTFDNEAPNYWKNRNSKNVPEDYFPKNLKDRLESAIAEYEQAKKEGRYVDVHNYQFTPQTFAQIVDTLNSMGLTNMRVHRLYETLGPGIEFCVILKKCGEEKARD